MATASVPACAALLPQGIIIVGREVIIQDLMGSNTNRKQIAPFRTSGTGNLTRRKLLC